MVTSRIEARVKCICARCLEPFALTLTSQFQVSLKPKQDLTPPEEVELSREDLETDFYEGEEINLSPLVQDQVLLTVPPKARLPGRLPRVMPGVRKKFKPGNLPVPGEEG